VQPDGSVAVEVAEGAQAGSDLLELGARQRLRRRLAVRGGDVAKHEHTELRHGAESASVDDLGETVVQRARKLQRHVRGPVAGSGSHLLMIAHRQAALLGARHGRAPFESVAPEHIDVGRLGRVVVVGPYGAGKTWLAHELGLVLQLPVHHLDALRWRGDWTLLPRPEWVALLERLVAGDAWVMDGNFEGTLDIRLRRCETILVLDAPLLLSFLRTIRRRLSRAERRDLPPELRERLNVNLLRLFVRYRRDVRPQLLELVSAHAAGRQVVVLRRRADAHAFLDAVRARVRDVRS
jgi:adenylate kinase family enzyme